MLRITAGLLKNGSITKPTVTKRRCYVTSSNSRFSSGIPSDPKLDDLDILSYLQSVYDPTCEYHNTDDTKSNIQTYPSNWSYEDVKAHNMVYGNHDDRCK
jgi:hypothetical protein